MATYTYFPRNKCGISVSLLRLRRCSQWARPGERREDGRRKVPGELCRSFFLPHLLQNCCCCCCCCRRGGSPSCQRRQKKLCVNSRSGDCINRRKCVHGALTGTICGGHRANCKAGYSCVKQPFLDLNGLFFPPGLFRRRVTFTFPYIWAFWVIVAAGCWWLPEVWRRTNLSPRRLSGHWRHETVCHLRASAGKSKEESLSAGRGRLQTQSRVSVNLAHSDQFCIFVQKANGLIQVICP